jgi:hypothetical protein
MKNKLYLVFIVILWLQPYIDSAQNFNTAGKKYAFVVGISHYRKVPYLKNTLNDANDMDSILTKLGFDVWKCLDCTRDSLSDSLDSWGKKIMNADIAFFYYAGHGVEANETDYLLGTNSNPQSTKELNDRAYPINLILDKMDNANSKCNIIILDACRDNPLASTLNRGIGTKGLIGIKIPVGYFIGYAAQPGNTASDGVGRNGIYTEAILKYIDMPCLSIDELFNKIDHQVRDETNNAQTPYKNSSLDDYLYFSINQSCKYLYGKEVKNDSANAVSKINEVKFNIKNITSISSETYLAEKIIRTKKYGYIKDKLAFNENNPSCINAIQGYTSVEFNNLKADLDSIDRSFYIKENKSTVFDSSIGNYKELNTFSFNWEYLIKANTKVKVLDIPNLNKEKALSFFVHGGVKLDTVGLKDNCGLKYNKESAIQYSLIIIDDSTHKQVASKEINEFSNYGGKNDPLGVNNYINLSDTLFFSPQELNTNGAVSVYLKVLKASLIYKHTCVKKIPLDDGINNGLYFNKDFTITVN